VSKEIHKKQFFEKVIWGLSFMVMLTLPLKDGLLWAQEEQSAPAEVVIVENVGDLSQYKSNKFLDRIKAEIGSSEDELQYVNRQISETQGKISEAQIKIGTLKDQLANLDAQIKSSIEIINNLTGQIDKKQSDIDTMEYAIEQKKVEISYQKQMISEYLKVIFKDQSELNSQEGDQSYLNTLKLLMSDQSTSEKLRSIRYSEVLEEQGREIFERLGDLIEEQEAQQKILEVKKDALTLMYQKVTEEKKELDTKKLAKENLLTETKGQEKIYQQLLAQSKANQEDVLLEIETLRKNLSFVQGRIKKLNENFNPDDYAGLLRVGKSSKLLGYLTSGDENLEFLPIWPVNPARGVSAFFHEASYVKVFGMQHNAVDIRAYQDTPIKAAADAVVYRAQDNGYGYSYIMLAHDGGYMTLYGHVAGILVNEGDSVKQGDIIGLSGATPGTRGAGLYTTGPHLHFEVLKNGVNVDPLDYLNLAYLNFDVLPEKYVAKALGDRQKVRRMPEKPKVRNTSKQLEVE
jgi:murein DD-endopeptidase MepM/ murein hydrolase activator NlpD